MSQLVPESMARIVDFAEVPGVPCPCGTARRAFAEVDTFPATVHVTEICESARIHYHKRLTETYYILECGPDAAMYLDGSTVPVRPGVCILIPPGVRHSAVGKMRVLIVAMPKFDPDDEWFDGSRSDHAPGGIAEEAQTASLLMDGRYA